MGGKSTRIGTYKCYECRKPFTVNIGTIFESSHVKMHIWLQAIFLIASSKKGISTNQLHRTLGVTLKTAWFLSHRIREMMKPGQPPIFGNGGGIVEADETYIGQNKQKAAQQEAVYERKPRAGAIKTPYSPLWSATARPIASISPARCSTASEPL